ncbi:MAG TPA: uridine diphosphate-N-acetylglucosamine-binding protein YvcK [Chloroflexota bacterium]|nr:uridine diphosphate-N-acetylglucosamine-binding protein YvcK [Chloroflexota bacterium]
MSALFKLLRPGLHVKRWFLIVLIGMVVISLGIGYALTELYRTADVPGWVGFVTLQFVPQLLRAALFLLLGGAICVVGLLGLYRSLADVLAASSSQSLIERIYDYRVRQGGPRIVCIGGGTGMPTVLRGLKHHSANITAIVTVGDDGGSSGRLRREHGILPPGDFRNNIVALAEVEPLMARLFQYRFGEGSALGGHSFGNLFVLAMTGVTGSFEHALRETSRVLAVQGTILPSTLQDVEICAEFSDGSEVCGESQIPQAGKPIERIRLRPEHPGAQPEAVKAILEADLVVLGPGSLYTSVVPNLLVEGIAKALIQTDALKIYVCNVATQPGETDGYDVDAHVAALVRHLPGQVNPLDLVIATVHPEGTVTPQADIALLVAGPDRGGHPRIVVDNVVRDDHPLRHDPEKLATVLMRVYEEDRRGRSTNGTVRAAH